MTFTQNGKAERMLRRLTRGPATEAELWEASGASDTPSQRRKFGYRLRSMIRDRLIAETPQGFEITGWGLAELDNRDAMIQPSVRIFAREAA
jgi:hypothetical protein